MNAQKKDLKQEGSISFGIRIKDNPPFKEPESNINFMLNKDIGGILLTILKEKENLRIDIDNQEYGKTKIVYKITKYLKEDMIVFLTWKENIVKLYLNRKLVEEEILKKGHGMINVIYDSGANELLENTDISYDEVYQTINDRHRGLLITANPLAIGAIHWFDLKIVFVIATVTKSRNIGNILRFEEVTANLILRLKDKLPAGNINKKMDFVEILNMVAESFGVPVTTQKNGQSKMLHIESDWDGEIGFKTEKEQNILIQGSFSPDKNKCYYVWVFSLEKYRAWLKSSFS